MRQFYLAFPICDALRHELGWTHYRILMRETDPIAREWYMNESVASGHGQAEDVEVASGHGQNRDAELLRMQSRARVCFTRRRGDAEPLLT